MSLYESTVVIPVYNKWDLTRKCLRSIAATTQSGGLEVIVVDNASSDVTPKVCESLGRQLFGSRFKYIRNEQNRNFAGASNQGAEAARGEYLIFLNNDTEAQPGWYDSLIDDFAQFSHLAGTGSVLFYPHGTPFGHQAQHLGVFVMHYYKFGHLYQGIPSLSPLVSKRRFFQVITAACLMMPKNLFLDYGKFDENFINGFEDVDLCGRLSAAGFRFTINPQSRVIHHESQTPGRKNNDGRNYALLQDKSLKNFHPDWQELLHADNLRFEINEWCHFQIQEEAQTEELLNSQLATMDLTDLLELLPKHFYWREGWEKLLEKTSGEKEFLEYFKIYFRLFRNVPNAARAVALGRKWHDRELQKQGQIFLNIYAGMTPEEIRKGAENGRDWCLRLGKTDLAKKYDHWLACYSNFKENIYSQYARLSGSTKG